MLDPCMDSNPYDPDLPPCGRPVGHSVKGSGSGETWGAGHSVRPGPDDPLTKKVAFVPAKWVIEIDPETVPVHPYKFPGDSSSYECDTCGSTVLKLIAVPQLDGWTVTCGRGHRMVSVPNTEITIDFRPVTTKFRPGDKVTRPEDVFVADSPLLVGEVVKVYSEISSLGHLYDELYEVRWYGRGKEAIPPVVKTGYLPHGLDHASRGDSDGSEDR